MIACENMVNMANDQKGGVEIKCEPEAFKLSWCLKMCTSKGIVWLANDIMSRPTRLTGLWAHALFNDKLNKL